MEWLIWTVTGVLLLLLVIGAGLIIHRRAKQLADDEAYQYEQVREIIQKM